jgi:nitrogen regulatory protein P-II 1
LGIASIRREEGMVKIEAVIQHFKLDDVKVALEDLSVGLITISEVTEHSTLPERRASYRGAQYCVDTPRVKLEILASSERADEIVDAILRTARTSMSEDDGRILVFEVADAVRIRTGERLQYTLA